MRDPLTWSFPIGRFFGITVRIHLLFVFFLIAMVGRGLRYDLATEALVVSLLLFGSVLLHEFGHCFAARSVDGDASEILLWPLGGLATVEVPHTPWANFVTTAGGPLVNLAIFVVAGGALLGVGLWPPMPPFIDWGPIAGGPLPSLQTGRPEALSAAAAFAARLFFLNWILFWFNVLLIGFPLDGGRLLQAALWPRLGYRRATSAAVFCGWIVALLLCLYVALTIEDDPYFKLLLIWLALFIYVSCKQQFVLLETGGIGDEGAFGYDFSQGYTSLERESGEPRPRKVGFWRRWLQRRAEKRRQRDLERQQAEERRVDELLDKVQRSGMQSLTDEERRFLTRVSAKYRHRQQ